MYHGRHHHDIPSSIFRRRYPCPIYTAFVPSSSSSSSSLPSRRCQLSSSVSVSVPSVSSVSVSLSLSLSSSSSILSYTSSSTTRKKFATLLFSPFSNVEVVGKLSIINDCQQQQQQKHHRRLHHCCHLEYCFNSGNLVSGTSNKIRSRTVFTAVPEAEAEAEEDKEGNEKTSLITTTTTIPAYSTEDEDNESTINSNTEVVVKEVDTEIVIDKLVSLQKEISTFQLKKLQRQQQEENELEQEQQLQKQHIEHQKRVFDELASFFDSKEAVPEILIPAYKYLAKQILDTIIITKAAMTNTETSLVVTSTPLSSTTSTSASTTINDGNIKTNNSNKNNNSTIHTNDDDDVVVVVYNLLDVACGTGVLWEYLAEEANARSTAAGSTTKIKLQITGIDVSTNMVEAALNKADVLFEKYFYNSINDKQQRHTFQVIQGDISTFSTTTTTTTTNPISNNYDGIILNACYGNFRNQSAVLENIVSNNFLTSNDKNNGCYGGVLFVTHPLGSEFVRRLNQEDNITVPNILPNNRIDWEEDTFVGTNLHLLDFVNNNVTLRTDGSECNHEQQQQQSNNNEITKTQTQTNSSIIQSSSYPLYYTSALRTRATTIPTTMKFRGTVDTGYGRGGKKLGFPTANLPSTLFQNALENITNGVYFGWALLEDYDITPTSTITTTKDKCKIGRNIPLKAVVNVGFSPTFTGQENREKVIEAHLILKKRKLTKNSITKSTNDDNNGNNNDDSDDDVIILDPPDFYGEILRLQLIGMLRPEIKFPSFDALIQQIQQDVYDADYALTSIFPYNTTYLLDPFLTTTTTTPTPKATKAKTAATLLVPSVERSTLISTNNNTKNCWIGSSGGNDTASWEFSDTRTLLRKIRRDETNNY